MGTGNAANNQSKESMSAVIQDEADQGLGTSAPKNTLKSSSNGYKVYTRGVLFQAMRPFIYTLQLFGLYFTKNYKTQGMESTKGTLCTKDTVSSEPVEMTGSQLYSGLVLILHWLNVIRIFTLIDPADGFGPILFMKLIAVSWMAMCATNVTALFYGWHSPDALPSFFAVWDSLQSSGMQTKKICPKYIRHRIIIFTLIGICLVLTNVFSTGYVLLTTFRFDGLISPLSLEGVTATAVKLAYTCTIHVFLSVSWILPAVFSYVVCIICYVAFRDLKHDFRAQISTDGTFAGDMEHFRRKHQLICHLVDHADKYLSIQAGGVVFINSMALLLTIYNLLTVTELREDAWSLVTNIFWAASGVINIGITCVGSALVNDEAHGLVVDIADINIDRRVTECGLQLPITMFLSRLNGSPIGLSAMKMFVIDKDMIIALSGMMITYFVLIIQFASLNRTEDACNCTESIVNSTSQFMATRI